MNAYHITISTLRRDPLATSSPGLRRLVRGLVRVCGAELLLFCVVDDHMHVVVVGTRRRAGAIAGALVRCRELCERRLDRAHVRKVEGRSHLEWLVRYLLTQASKHGLPESDALYEGSCFQDLVGARLLPGFDRDAIWRWLPRRGLDFASGVVGVKASSPVDDETLAQMGVAEVVSAAAVTSCSDLQGNRPEAAAGRRVATVLLLRAGRTSPVVAEHFAVDGRSTRRWAASADQDLVHAARVRLALVVGTSQWRRSERTELVGT